MTTHFKEPWTIDISDLGDIFTPGYIARKLYEFVDDTASVMGGAAGYKKVKIRLSVEGLD